MQMKTNVIRYGMAATTGLLCLAQPGRASAEVSDADFNALKSAVQQLSEQVQSLRETNQIEAQTHQADLQQIQELRSKLAETQKTAADAEQKSTAVAEIQSQPPPRAPIDEATVNHNFQILGDAEFQYDKVQGQNGTFLLADFAPIFLYRGGDNILFEAGFDTTIQNGGTAPANSGYNTTFNLSFAQLDYVVNDYVTFAAGDLLLPLGTYSQRGAGWLNKIPDDPLAVDALIPGTGVGAQLLGAVPVGQSGQFINYAVYGVNGPSSSDTTGNAASLDLGGNVGLRSDGAVASLNGNPSGGARVGYFVPFKPHYDAEVGVSGMSGQWDNAVDSHIWSAGVLDAALHLGPNFEAKGEFNLTRYGSSDQGEVTQQGWFAQAGYKLAGLNLELPGINNMELVGRYDAVQDGLNPRVTRYTAGFIYYITNTLLFEGDYEFLHSLDPSQVDQLILQVSYGF
jgi:hypothetical protein